MQNYKLKNEHGKPTGIEIEVEDLQAEVLIKIDRKTEVNDRKFKRRSLKTGSLDYLRDKHNLDIADDEANPEAQLVAEETEAERQAQLAALPFALDKLSQRHRLIIELHYLHGKTEREIARLLNIDAGNLHRQIQTALANLRKFFEKS